MDGILMQSNAGDYYEAQSRFQDLGKAFTVLLKNSDLHAILPAILDSLLNDLDWMLDNQAACLLFTCSEMVNFYFSFLFIKDESRRIAGLLAAVSVEKLFLLAIIACSDGVCLR